MSHPSPSSPQAADEPRRDWVREAAPNARLERIGLSAQAYRLTSPKPFCDVIVPIAGEAEGDATDYLHEQIFASPGTREAFFEWIDARGLVVLRGLATTARVASTRASETYRGVRGRSSKGRLSQGEYYHHDGCSGPTKPRVVEIRCPYQRIERSVHTAAAPFPENLRAMWACLPEALRSPAIASAAEVLELAESGARDALDALQGLMTRAVRRELSAEAARAYFREVDARCGAYIERWHMGESRFIANANAGRTLQHRRAYMRPHLGGSPTGHLCKRWPWEELGFADSGSLAPLCSEDDAAWDPENPA